MKTALLTLALLVLATPGLADNVPREEIPELPMPENWTDYEWEMTLGSLVPFTLDWEGTEVRRWQTEAEVVAVLGSDFCTVEEEERTREEQWAYLREFLKENDDTMHYYTLRDIYYDWQLHGRFWVLQWERCDLKFRAHVREATPESVPEVWLLQVLTQPGPGVREVESPTGGRVLERLGPCKLLWNIGDNSLAMSHP